MRSVHPRYQFTPVWETGDMFPSPLTRGLKPVDFLLTGRGQKLCACLALWDQRAFRQTVVRGYAGKLALLRHAMNPLAGLAGLPRLPKVGDTLRHAWLSHLTWRDEDPEALLHLIQQARSLAAQRELDSVLFTLSDSNPMLRHVSKHFRHLRYRRQLGLVHWESPSELQGLLDGRPIHVESAIF
jgi:hypothetical protein